MADLLKILKEKQTQGDSYQPIAVGNKPAALPAQSETELATDDEREVAIPSLQMMKQTQEIAAPNGSKRTSWGIPIPEGSDPCDRVFTRHPRECDCFRAGVLRCGVPCVWAWPQGAKVGDKAVSLDGTKVITEGT